MHLNFFIAANLLSVLLPKTELFYCITVLTGHMAGRFLIPYRN
jgi:hypothetical protein